MNPLDFLRATPKSNCGQCGHLTCLAFAVAVTKGGADPARCPFLADSAPAAAAPSAGSGLAKVERGQEERDLALVAHLKSKVRDLDYAAIASRLGAGTSEAGERLALNFAYLGRKVLLDGENALLEGGQLIDPRDQILLYNYVASGGGEAPRDDWVGMESLPNSMAKVRTLAAYCEQPLASRFAERGAALARACAAVGAGPGPEGQSADLGLIIPVLPRVPLYLLFWDAEPTEGFASRVKVLFDRQVLDFLDIESLVFAAERMAERLLELDA